MVYDSTRLYLHHHLYVTSEEVVAVAGHVPSVTILYVVTFVAESVPDVLTFACRKKTIVKQYVCSRNLQYAYPLVHEHSWWKSKC